jgi:hypothetical protein
MNVVEKDNLIQGMLKEELERNKSALKSLSSILEKLPKGSVHIREKKYKKNVYSYHYLKYRNNGKNISKHIPDDKLEELLRDLEKYKKYAAEAQVYEKRIKYLENILKQKI